MRAFLMNRDMVLVGLNPMPLMARWIRSGIIAALNIIADKTAVFSPSPRMLRAFSWGRVDANITGTIAKYLATSFAMLKVVTAPRVMSNCFPSMTTSMIFAGFDSKSHIGSSQGGGIVRAVPDHGHDPVLGLFPHHDLILVLGLGLGSVLVYPHLVRDALRGQRLVTGQHDRTDPHHLDRLDLLHNVRFENVP